MQDHPRICIECVLPESFPGISFDEEGLCNHCRKYQKSGPNDKIRQKYLEKFEKILENVRQQKNLNYDVVLAYSGGKDSTYTFKVLVEQYHLRVLAVIFDNHFVSPLARKNIEVVCQSLGSDLFTFRPSWDVLQKIFSVAAKQEIFAPKTLERASTVCTACIGMVKGLLLKMAIDRNIPMVAFGWSPGQAPIQSAVMRTNPSLIRQTQKALFLPLSKIAGDDEMKRFFLSDEDFEKAEKFPYNIHPLALLEYNENKIIEEIKTLGWRLPSDTDTNSTNCLLNAFANQVHIERYKFHPYVWEIANMVREGIVSRDEGVSKIYSPQDETMVSVAKEKLGLSSA